MTAESAEAIALFRYRVIAEATSARLSPAERGRLVRELAANFTTIRMEVSVSIRAARSTAGYALIASRAWMASSRSHAPTWARSVATQTS